MGVIRKNDLRRKNASVPVVAKTETAVKKELLEAAEPSYLMLIKLTKRKNGYALFLDTEDQEINYPDLKSYKEIMTSISDELKEVMK